MMLKLHNDGTEFFCDQCKKTVQRTRDNPFPEHTCSVSNILDLRAVKVWITELEKLYTARAAYYGEERLLKQDLVFAKTLLAHVRALRAALIQLQDWAKMVNDDTFGQNDFWPAGEEWDNAAAVLASATDEEES